MDRRIFWFWWFWKNLQIYKELRYIYNQLPVTPSVRGEKSYSVLQMDRWIFEHIWKIYKSTRNCQWIGRFFGFGCYWENLQIYKESRYTYSQLLLTASMRGKNIYSVLHMDRWIFGLKNLQIYKELPMDRRIFGFCYWENLQIYKESRYTYSQLLLTASMRGKNIYSVLHMDRWIFELKNLQIYKELPMDRKIFWFWMILGKSTILQGIALYL